MKGPVHELVFHGLTPHERCDRSESLQARFEWIDCTFLRRSQNCFHDAVASDEECILSGDSHWIGLARSVAYFGDTRMHMYKSVFAHNAWHRNLLNQYDTFPLKPVTTKTCRW